MCSVRFTLTTYSRKAMKRRLKTAQQQGNLRQVKYLLAILAVGDGRSFAEVAEVLRVHEKTVAAWVGRFCCDGIHGAPRQKPTGRPPKLTPTHQAALATLIDEGPLQAGFSGACWRSPMIQQLMYDRFGVFYHVFYMAQLLKNLGFRYQKAAFVSDPLDEGKRQAWGPTTWPQMLRLANEQKALLWFGDEASFPQWGTLSYTWARRGHQPMVKTSGKRKGYKVFGVIEYFTGRFWYQGQEGRLTSETYMAFLTRVLAQVTQPIMLIQDGAKYHTSVAMQRFFALHTERLTVFQLPSYSPDYHPIEKLWKKVKKEGTHLQYFPTFAALTATVEHALLTFAKTPAEILALCSLPTVLAQAA
jgi:transposase